MERIHNQKRGTLAGGLAYLLQPSEMLVKVNLALHAEGPSLPELSPEFEQLPWG